ncbi:MAG TPA: hypothetical protein VMP67_00305 [Candidatus Limnocylindria bacterium]|nr:hypothetical protein [Candidatus Limnocylindria bacterium]
MDNDDALGARLDRQERPPERRPIPQRIPETRPPLLGDWFIYLSIVVLVCGVVAITALNLGQTLDAPLVRLPLLLAGGLLLVLAADATLRVWRSAWAWLPIDRGRGLFRFVWTAVLLLTLLATGVGLLFLLTA